MAYNKYTWSADDEITAERLNHMEAGIEEASSGGSGGGSDVPSPIEGDEGKVLVVGENGLEWNQRGYSYGEYENIIFDGDPVVSSSGAALGTETVDGSYTPPRSIHVSFDGEDYDLLATPFTGGNTNTLVTTYGAPINSETGSPDFSEFPFTVADVREGGDGPDLLMNDYVWLGQQYSNAYVASVEAYDGGSFMMPEGGPYPSFSVFFNEEEYTNVPLQMLPSPDGVAYVYGADVDMTTGVFDWSEYPFAVMVEPDGLSCSIAANISEPDEIHVMIAGDRPVVFYKTLVILAEEIGTHSLTISTQESGYKLEDEFVSAISSKISGGGSSTSGDVIITIDVPADRGHYSFPSLSLTQLEMLKDAISHAYPYNKVSIAFEDQDSRAPLIRDTIVLDYAGGLHTSEVDYVTDVTTPLYFTNDVFAIVVDADTGHIERIEPVSPRALIVDVSTSHDAVIDRDVDVMHATFDAISYALDRSRRVVANVSHSAGSFSYYPVMYYSVEKLDPGSNNLYRCLHVYTPDGEKVFYCLYGDEYPSTNGGVYFDGGAPGSNDEVII